MHEAMRMAAIGVLVLCTYGCATIFTGTNDTIQITTEPDDARIYVDGRMVGRGEETLTISRSGPPPRIRVEKEGYQTQEFKPESEFNYVAMTNSTVIFFWATDIVSGSVVRYTDDKYHVQLVRQGSAGLTQEQRLTRFALVNWTMISTNLAAGDGEYLDALVSLAPSDRSESAFRTGLQANRKGLLAADGAREFAALIGEIYEGATTSAKAAAAG